MPHTAAKGRADPTTPRLSINTLGSTIRARSLIRLYQSHGMVAKPEGRAAVPPPPVRG